MKTKLNMLMACSIMLSACGSLKSNKALHTQSLQSNSDYQEGVNQQSWVKGSTLLLDTSNSEYVVQITPLGKFLYSAEGVAEKVLIRGKASKRQLLHQQQEMGTQVQHKKRIQESTALKTRVQQIVKSRKPPLSSMCIALVMVLGSACWVMRKRLFT